MSEDQLESHSRYYTSKDLNPSRKEGQEEEMGGGVDGGGSKIWQSAVKPADEFVLK